MNDSTSSDEIRLIIETESGEQYEVNVPMDARISEVVADLYEEQGWPTTDSRGRGVRAVVDLVDPENPEKTKRLNNEKPMEEAGLFDGAILRVSSESIAGAVDERERVRALVADHRDLEELAEWNRRITFKANAGHAPTQYIVTFDHKSFSGLSADGHTPIIGTDHQVEITMGAEYPREAPRVKWLTPIFHPNIHRDTGRVCLGVIMDRYTPGLGLARLVIMLSEMVQYRNFDQTNPMDREAAEWTADPAHFKFIEGIGGAPFQGPIQDLMKKLDALLGKKEKRRKFHFKPLPRKGVYDDR